MLWINKSTMYLPCCAMISCRLLDSLASFMRTDMERALTAPMSCPMDAYTRTRDTPNLSDQDILFFFSHQKESSSHELGSRGVASRRSENEGICSRHLRTAYRLSGDSHTQPRHFHRRNQSLRLLITSLTTAMTFVRPTCSSPLSLLRAIFLFDLFQQVDCEPRSMTMGGSKAHRLSLDLFMLNCFFVMLGTSLMLRELHPQFTCLQLFDQHLIDHILAIKSGKHIGFQTLHLVPLAWLTQIHRHYRHAETCQRTERHGGSGIECRIESYTNRRDPFLAYPKDVRILFSLPPTILHVQNWLFKIQKKNDAKGNVGI